MVTLVSARAIMPMISVKMLVNPKEQQFTHKYFKTLQTSLKSFQIQQLLISRFQVPHFSFRKFEFSINGHPTSSFPYLFYPLQEYCTILISLDGVEKLCCQKAFLHTALEPQTFSFLFLLFDLPYRVTFQLTPRNIAQCFISVLDKG